MKKDIVTTFKAHPNGREPIPSLIIKAELPIPFGRDEKLSEVEERFEAEGRKLEKAFYRHLPGGIYDRLLAAMLRRRASHFVVPFGRFEEKPSSNG